MNIFQQKQQQQLYNQKFENELEKITMSWDNTPKEWYPYAMRALQFASVVKLNIHPLKYPEMNRTNKHGINMNVVSRLCNNLEERTPKEMGVTPEGWAEILKLNVEVGTQWNSLADPVKQKLNREFDIMNGNTEGLKIIKAEA